MIAIGAYMRGTRNIAFRNGFIFTFVVFGILNFGTYLINGARLAERQRTGIRFSNEGISWGFPIKMYIPFWGFDVPAVLVNFLIVSLVAGLVGFVAQVIFDKFIAYRAK